MPTALRLDHRYWAERRRLQLLDELRGRLRAIDFDCVRDPTGARRDELCALICRHERDPGGLPRPHSLPQVGEAGGSGRVGFGAPLTLLDLTTGETVSCHIGCPPEGPLVSVSPPRGLHPDHRICCTSPLGNALIGHREGEIVEVRGGGRTLRYEIVSVGF
jgi:hypothetical protein